MSEKPFKLSVKVIIKDDRDRLLILKRSMKSKGNPGKWDLPGGKLDPGERFDETLIREVYEETGLEIKIQHIAGTAESEMDTAIIIYLIMDAKLVAGKVRLSDEHDDYVWIRNDQFPKTDLAIQFIQFAKSYIQKK
jgi:8-oxo-dGTP diphosphatase